MTLLCGGTEPQLRYRASIIPEASRSKRILTTIIRALLGNLPGYWVRTKTGFECRNEGISAAVEWISNAYRDPQVCAPRRGLRISVRQGGGPDPKVETLIVAL